MKENKNIKNEDLVIKTVVIFNYNLDFNKDRIPKILKTRKEFKSKTFAK